MLEIPNHICDSVIPAGMMLMNTCVFIPVVFKAFALLLRVQDKHPRQMLLMRAVCCAYTVKPNGHLIYASISDR